MVAHPVIAALTAVRSITGGLPPDLDMRECLNEEHADVPATQQDYQNELPSRCLMHRTLLVRFTVLEVSVGGRP
jgi:hypothetical protein